ncbi:hypothetical protein B0H17DRAFT_1141854 [Mycena rosella]|uniref:DUF6535 domain-containing protein n=1 Tax=Mycena rosella TaxID=1033263 RepID=A0AAD7D2C3_MYCRO|nr:hypothetical protein B0H17DRAFT_1141854 [Mycena rosella]
MNNSISSGPEISIPEPTVPSIITVIGESFLYVSLFSTLLAALLVVLGKQWLLYYVVAGERACGTTEQRCLERQRKMDGMHKWKLETVLNMHPLLLQLSLLLFTAALSLHLWQTRHSIAGFVLALATVGFLLYAFLAVSPVISPDSPFRTPRADLLIAVLLAIITAVIKIFYHGKISLEHGYLVTAGNFYLGKK